MHVRHLSMPTAAQPWRPPPHPHTLNAHTQSKRMWITTQKKALRVHSLPSLETSPHHFIRTYARMRSPLRFLARLFPRTEENGSRVVFLQGQWACGDWLMGRRQGLWEWGGGEDTGCWACVEKIIMTRGESDVGSTVGGQQSSEG